MILDVFFKGTKYTDGDEQDGCGGIDIKNNSFVSKILVKVHFLFLFLAQIS